MKRGRVTRKVSPRLFGLALLAFFLASSAWAVADEGPTDLFSTATNALADGRVGDAITAFEGLADRGALDPVASYDRGLAYAARVRIGAEQPGDLGRAAQGFEEARSLTHDAKLADDASRALSVVRSEIARRRMRAGQPAEVDPGRSLGSTLAGVLSEATWATLAVVSSIALSAGLFARWLGRASRLRVAGGITAGVAAFLLAASAAMTLAARHDRTSVREAVVVTASARPSDERGVSIPGATPIPEGARVEIVDDRGDLARVRFGTLDAWIVSGALREIAQRR